MAAGRSSRGTACAAWRLSSPASQDLQPQTTVTIETDAGVKPLELLARDGERYTFRAAMGQPTNLRQTDDRGAGESVTASVLEVGNPQCVVLGPLPDVDRFNRLGPALATHPMFPAGTNVEFAEVEAADRVRILIWERGVGPTTSSGTGSSASAVAAAAHGGASRSVDVVAPGGTQRVEWREDGVHLTGWAEVVLEGVWTGTIRFFFRRSAARSSRLQLDGVFLVRAVTYARRGDCDVGPRERVVATASICFLTPINRRSASMYSSA